MARLTAAQRRKLPKKVFAGPHRSFPIPDKAHARAALQDLPKAKDLTLKEAQRIHAAAERKLKGK
jgi:hypothetical protein